MAIGWGTVTLPKKFLIISRRIQPMSTYTSKFGQFRAPQTVHSSPSASHWAAALLMSPHPASKSSLS
eukprot:8992824-Lingulodinium_polyedra.AAC.1